MAPTIERGPTPVRDPAADRDEPEQEQEPHLGEEQPVEVRRQLDTEPAEQPGVGVPGADRLVAHVGRVPERGRERHQPHRGERQPTATIAATRPVAVRGREHNQITPAAETANTATTRWLVSVAARNTAGSQSPRRRSSANASVPRKNSANAIAIVNEYSPASVLVSVPPMMWWSNVIVASPPSLKNRKAVAPTAKSAGAGRGARMPRANT